MCSFLTPATELFFLTQSLPVAFALFPSYFPFDTIFCGVKNFYGSLPVHVFPPHAIVYASRAFSTSGFLEKFPSGVDFYSPFSLLLTHRLQDPIT